MKLTIHKYIFNEIWPTFSVSLFIFVMVMLTTRLMTITEWIITYGVHPFHLAKLILYLLPRIVLFALPAASLIAVIVAFLRLSSDNEIIALKSSGVSLYQMLPPVVVFSLMGCLLAGAAAFFGAPWGNKAFKATIYQVAESRAEIGIRERVFSEPFNDVVFYVNRFSIKDKIMEDVFVVDKRDSDLTNTIVAKEGRFLLNPKRHLLTIHFSDGTAFMMDKGLTAARSVKFNTYDLNIGLGDIMPALSSKKKAPSEMFIEEIKKELAGMPGHGLRYNELVVELMEKFAVPLAVFLMGMIGAPLGAQIKAGGRAFGIGVGLVVFLMYYMLLTGTRSIGETGILSPYLCGWIPALFLVVSFFFLIRRAANERPIGLIESISIRMGGPKQAMNP